MRDCINWEKRETHKNCFPELSPDSHATRKQAQIRTNSVMTHRRLAHLHLAIMSHSGGCVQAEKTQKGSGSSCDSCNALT